MKAHSVSNEIAVIDTGVSDYRTLQRAAEEAGLEVILLSDQGIAGLAEQLQGRESIDALHVFSHGSEGELYLGGETLSNDTLEQHKESLQLIRESLSEEADLLLYGCNVASGDAGRTFLNKLSAITGADIAASEDLTGSSALGGDWELEKTVGEIDAGLISATDYQHLLPFSFGTATFGVDQIAGTGANFNVNASVTDMGGFGFDFSLVGQGQINIVNQIPTTTSAEDKSAVVSTGNNPYTISQVSIKSTDGSDFSLDSMDFALGGPNSGVSYSLVFEAWLNGSKLGDFSKSIVMQGSNYLIDFSAESSLFRNVDELVVKLPTPMVSSLMFDDIVTSSPVLPNVAPTVTLDSSSGGNDYSTSWTEGNSAPAIADTDSDIVDTDDDASINTVTVTLTNDQNGSSEYLTSTVINGNVTVGNNNTDTITLTNAGSATTADFEAVLEGIQWVNTSDAPDTTSRTVTVVANDGTDDSTTATTTISVTATNDAPVLADTVVALSAINEDAGDDDGSGADNDNDASNNTDNQGDTVAGILTAAITDPDGSAVEAIAVTNVDNTDGVWQYSTDAGTTWNNFSATTGSSVDISSTSVLLDSANKVRFVPDQNYSGSSTFTFRAWDKSTGVVGGTADTSSNGITTAFSTATDTASITVNAVDDAPTGSGAATPASFTEDTQGDLDLSGFTVTDVDSASVTITLTASAGTLAASSSGGVVVGGNSSALTLTGSPSNINTWLDTTTNVKYTGASNANGTGAATITITGADGTTSNVAMGSVSLNISAVNDAPTLTATGDDSTYVEGASAVSVFSSAAIDTIESGQSVASLVFTVTNVAGDGSAEFLTLDGFEFAFNSHSGTTTSNSFAYSVALVAGTATVTVTKTDTVTNYQTLLDGMTYRNSIAGLDSNDRVVTVTTLQDDGGTANGGDDTAENLTISSTITLQPAPAITGVAYDGTSNQLVVTGTDFVATSGANNDVDATKLTLTGEAGGSYTLTSASNVEITSATEFTITLSGADLTRVEALLNKDGTQAADGTTDYNLNAAEDWMPGAENSADIASATNAITMSNYAAPVITSSTYDFSTGVLVLTGNNFVSNGSANDIDATLLTFTGEGGNTYTLTANTSNVNISSDTQATVTLGAEDTLNVNGLLNKDGTQADDGTTNYNLAVADNWLTGVGSSLDISDATTGVTVSSYATPAITSATYDSDTGLLVVTGTNLVKQPGADNDIDISHLTFTGEGGSYNLTSASDVEISSATSFTITLSGIDKTGVDARLDQIGTSSSGGTTYNLVAADNWLAGAPASADISDTSGNAITVQIAPKITSATYDATTGDLVVTGTNIQAKAGGTNDIDASQFTLTGEGGETYQLTDTSDVERTSATEFTLALSATDKAAVNQILNNDGSTSTGGTTFNLAAGDDWNTEVTAGDTSDSTNSITVSNIPVPTITGATYDAAMWILTVSGTGFLKLTGSANDIDVTKLTLTGEGGEAHTLTSSHVEITNDTQFTVNLNAADQAVVGLFLNKEGMSSTSGTLYNLAAAENWAAGAGASVVDADLAGKGVTVSNVLAPTIASATYNAKTGVLVVTGNHFLEKSGTENDIDVSALTLVGEAGATRVLTSTDVDITSATEFSLTLNSADKSVVDALLNKAGTASNDNTTYNLIASEDWAVGADPAVNVADMSGNGITVTLNAVPTSTDTTESVGYNSSYTFQASDFAFNDSDSGDTLQGINLKTLPGDGDLYLNNVVITATETFVSLADLNSSLLTYRPDNGGTGNGYASFTFTVNDGADDSVTPNTVTLNVASPPPPPPTPAEPEEETTTDQVDGVDVKTTTKMVDGEEVKTVVVDPVSNEREDTDNTTQNADIPLHFTEGDSETVTTVRLPSGVGFEANANDTALNNNSTDVLLDLIEEAAGASEEGALKSGGQQFLDVLGIDEDNLWVNKVTLTTNSNTPPDSPITIQGSDNSSRTEALVIDASDLPSGTILNLDNIEFAVIVGPASIFGGDGQNTLYAGAGSQFIILGPDDDELHGGPGNDTVGSEGGDDLIFGDSGNDTLFGGEGKDQLHGGSDTDTATFEGDLDDFIVEQVNGLVTVRNKVDDTDVDTLINIERIQFEDQVLELNYESDLEALATLYQQALGRQADVDGFQWWANDFDNGYSKGNTAINILRSDEATGYQGFVFDGLSTEEQIEALYTQLLGRDSDAGGKAYWLGEFENGSSIDHIAGGFMDSAEFQQSYLAADEWSFIV